MGSKATFSKPFLELRDLIALLRARGLDVDISDADAEAYLSTVNYYRFTGYAVAFQSDREHFKMGARFSDIQAIYAYDRRLRELVFSAAEAVESMPHHKILCKKPLRRASNGCRHVKSCMERKGVCAHDREIGRRAEDAVHRPTDNESVAAVPLTAIRRWRIILP